MAEEKKGVLFEVTDANIAKAKETNPGVALCIVEVDTDTGESFAGIFRRPDVLTLQKYLSEVNAEKDSGVRASAAFVSTVIVYPSKEDYFSLQKNLPLLSIGLANELFKGFGSVKSSKKKSI